MHQGPKLIIWVKNMVKVAKNGPNSPNLTFKRLSVGLELNWATIMGIKPGKEQRKLLTVTLPKVKFVKATTAYLRTSVHGDRILVASSCCQG